MISVTATAARKDFYNLISQVNDDCKPIAITTSKGKGAVLVGEDDWASIEETLYISSIPGMAKKIDEACNEEAADSVPADSLDW